MDFKHKLLKYIAEATGPANPKIGQSVSKEIAISKAGANSTSSSGTSKARDAARQRKKRQNAPKRDQLPQVEVLSQIIAVKNTKGQTALIYRDSFNNSYHEVLNPEKDLSIEDAQALTTDPAFIQTPASLQLFGDLTKKAESKERKRAAAEFSQRFTSSSNLSPVGCGSIPHTPYRVRSKGVGKSRAMS